MYRILSNNDYVIIMYIINNKVISQTTPNTMAKTYAKLYNIKSGSAPFNAFFSITHQVYTRNYINIAEFDTIEETMNYCLDNAL